MVDTDGANPIRKEIPDKLYFKIGEVCKITGIKQHALRYWETEFSVIRPQRASSKQRLYRRIDVENILKIKKLLREDGYSIAGVKKLFIKCIMLQFQYVQRCFGNFSIKGGKQVQIDIIGFPPTRE